MKQLRVAHGDFQFLTFDETPRFLRAAAPEWKAFVTTALKTGLCVGELLALRWEDLDLVAGRLVVRRTLWRDQEGTPKGGRTREVPLSDEAIAVLKAHRHLSPDVKRDAVRLLDGPAPISRFDFGALRAPTLTANGEESPTP